MIQSTDLIKKHSKNMVGRIMEWMDVNNLPKDSKVLIMCAIAKSCDDKICEHILSESKLVENSTNEKIWESLEICKNKQFNSDILEHFIGLAKKKFNELTKQYPLSPDKDYNLDLLNSVMAEGNLTNGEKRNIVKAFVVGNNDVVVEEYNSGIKKLLGVINVLEEAEPFDYELSAMVFMESNRIFNEENVAADERTAEKEREEEREAESEKNKEEFADQNIAKAKNQNAPLAKALRAQGVSQDEAADILDVDKSTISRIKSGSRKPSFDLLKKMNGKFGSIDSLFPELM